jgi:hypothetical protein
MIMGPASQERVTQKYFRAVSIESFEAARPKKRSIAELKKRGRFSGLNIIWERGRSSSLVDWRLNYCIISFSSSVTRHRGSWQRRTLVEVTRHKGGWRISSMSQASQKMALKSSKMIKEYSLNGKTWEYSLPSQYYCISLAKHEFPATFYQDLKCKNLHK